MPRDLLRPLTIGDVSLPNNLVLSPMAGFSDLPFRILAKRAGAGLVCSEMVAAANVARGRIPGTQVRMATLDEERPMSIQVFGTDPDAVATATRDVARQCAIIGFNMGCPAHRIKREGCGAALLDDPDTAVDVVTAMDGATSKPLLVKLRAGNLAPIDIERLARRLEAAGADALIVHGRTAKQGYSGSADWKVVARVKAAVSVPVIGNGDVTDGPSAARALAESGADGVAVGRASLGDPWVFERIVTFLATGEHAALPTPQQRLDGFREYLRLAGLVGTGVPDADAAAAAGTYALSAQHIAEQAQQFTRGMRGASRLRHALSGVKDQAAVVAAFEAHVAASNAREAASSQAVSTG